MPTVAERRKLSEIHRAEKKIRTQRNWEGFTGLKGGKYYVAGVEAKVIRFNSRLDGNETQTKPEQLAAITRDILNSGVLEMRLYRRTRNVVRQASRRSSN